METAFLSPQTFKISVVIPFYRGRQYIRQAVESVLQQTLLPIELFIVNDGSPEDIPEDVLKIPTPFPIHVIFQHQQGQSAARNNAVEQSVGDYIAFLDQDDVWYPKHLEELAKPFLSNPRLGWAYSNFDEIDASGAFLVKGGLNKFLKDHPKTSLFQMLSTGNTILPSSSLVLKKAFEDVGGFDPELCGYEDEDFFTRMFGKGWGNHFISTPLIQWRVHINNTSKSTRTDESRALYFKKQLERWPDDPSSGKMWARDCVFPYFFYSNIHTYFRQCLEFKNFPRAKFVIQNAFDCVYALPEQKRLKYKILCFILSFPKVCYWFYKYLPHSWLKRAYIYCR